MSKSFTRFWVGKVNRKRNRGLIQRSPLRVVLIVPFLLQIFAAVGLTGYVSLRNGQQAVNDVATQLRQEMTECIRQQILNHLKEPYIIGQVVVTAIQDQETELTDFTRFETMSWSLIRQGIAEHVQISLVDGSSISVENTRNDEIVSRVGTREDLPKRKIYRLDDQGNRGPLLQEQAHYIPQERPWYILAKQNQKPSWTQPFIGSVMRTVAISLSQPIYDRKGVLLGVQNNLFRVEKIHHFLKELKVGQTGQTYIVDRAGNLIASSSIEQPYRVDSDHDRLQQIPAIQIDDSVIRATAQALIGRFGSFDAIQESHQLDFYLEDQHLFVQVAPIRNEQGINWLSIVTVPESTFMEQINANTRTTILLCFASLGGAALLGLYTSRWITRPILELQRASHQIAQGDLDYTVDVQSIDELEALGQAFNQMASQLKVSLQDRVAELVKTNQALKMSLDALATDPDIDSFIGRLLRTIATQFDVPIVEYWYHSPQKTAHLGMMYWQQQIYTRSQIVDLLPPDHPGVIGYTIPDALLDGECFYHRHQPIYVTDLATSILAEVTEWYRQQDIHQLLNFPMKLGENSIGAIAIYCHADHCCSTEGKELAQALTHQATLAVELTRLAKVAQQSALMRDRTFLAREIHDTLAQSYAGILVQLRAALRFLTHQPERAQTHFDRVLKLAQEGLLEARRSVWVLQQESTQYSDLAALLTQLIQQLAIDTSVPIQLKIEGNSYSLQPEVGMNLLRIAQEAISNALRHADPTQIQLKLTYRDREVTLSVQDDGKGFRLEQSSTGFGLRGMQQRADVIGAAFKLVSHPGYGTQISVTVPLTSI
jgi:signal transduction histidine kinase